MKFAVLGAGAVGCYYGGMLARAGHPVVLIGRPLHVQAIERDGLRMQTAHGWDERVRVAASTEVSAVQGADVVLFCVKGPDTESAARQIQPWLAPGALVVSLQNGVDNGQRLRAVLGSPHEVLEAVVYVATEMGGPGHLRHKGRGELVLGAGARSAALAALLAAAAVPTQVSDNVQGALWTKLVINCAFNALSAITQLPYGQLAQAEGMPQVLEALVAECLAVAQAEGVVMPADVRPAVQGIVLTMPGQYSSTAQDLARGKLSEIDQLNGHIVHRGEAHGVPTPANRTVYALVQLLQSHRLAAAPVARETA